MSRTAENEVAVFWMDDGVLRCEVKRGIDQTHAQALDSLRIFRELGGGVPRPVVIDIRHVKTLSREARACYSGTESAQVFKAAALVVASSSVARALANFILTVSRPTYPTHLFAAVEEAVAWARSHMEA